MKPRRIILIRHAESMGNADHSVYLTTPDWKITLSERGRQQAKEAGYILAKNLMSLSSNPSDHRIGIYLSPFRRSRETWLSLKEEISHRPIAFIKEDPRLREHEWGHMTSLEERQSELTKSIQYGTFFYRFPNGGESGADVYDRCSGFLDTIHRDFSKPDYPPTIIIITHGFTLRILLMRWFHWTAEYFDSLKNPKNAEMVELQLGEDNHYRLMKDFPRRT